MPTIAVGLQNVKAVMRVLTEEAQRVGAISRACLITPGLIGVQEADLLRLSERPREGIHYDGRKLWISGVDFFVQH